MFQFAVSIFMDYTLQLGIEILGSVIGAFLGAFLGYLGGMKLFRKQQEEEKKSNKKRLQSALTSEVISHKDIIKNQPQIDFDAEFLNVLMFSTASYDSSINSGLFSLLSPKSQNLISGYYTRCNYVNKLKYEILSLTSPKEHRRAEHYNENIRLAQDSIKEYIDIILRQLT